jgi:TonB family protein
MNFLHFGGLINYMFESTVCLSVFAFVYYFFLRQETFYGFNRAFLYITLLFSIIFPFIQLSGSELTSVRLPEILVGSQTIGTEIQTVRTGSSSDNDLMIWIYFAISVALVSIFTTRLSQLIHLARQSKLERLGKFTFVLHNHQYSAFSFFHFIFISNDDFESPDNKPVIEHEKVHVKLWHSIDVIFLELLLIVAWFNPFIWIYRHFFKENHEFTADHRALKSSESWSDYARLLLGRSFGLFINDFTLSFNKLSIKKRITMMKKSKSGRFLVLKSLLAVPFIPVLLGLLAFSGANHSGKDLSFTSNDLLVNSFGLKNPSSPQNDKAAPKAKKSESQADKKQQVKFVAPVVTDDKVYKVVKKMPEYPGGQAEMSKFLSQNIVYPQECKEKGIQGNVYISFIVEKSGEVSSAKVIRGANKLLDEEGLRVVKLMQRWTPGEEEGKPVRVEFTIPIRFKLDMDKKTDNAVEKK